MKYGLSDEQLQEIKAVVASYPEIHKVVLYGSRAMGNYKAASDVDLAIIGDNLPFGFCATIKDHFEEETYLPFFFDITDYQTINNCKLKQQINERGVVIYRRGQTAWKELTLEEIAFISTNSWKPGDSKEKYIGLEHIIENKLRISDIGCSTEVSSNKYIFKKGQILFGKLRPYFRKVVRPNFSGICSTDIWVINSKNGINTTFLFYLVASQKFIDISYASAGGTRMPRANWKFLSKTKWFIPPLSEQQAIAEVLSSLDDKIDLLHRQNKTLEDMAQTLFRQWFIEEAQDDWEEVALGDVISIFDNKRIPLSKMQRDKMKEGELFPYYGAAKIMDYVNEYIFDGEYILIGEDGTVQTDASYPVLQYAIGKFWVNNHTHVIQAKFPYANYFIWNYLLHKNIEKIITGAVQPKINQTNLKNLDFPNFPESLVSSFNEKSKNILQKINKTQTQIQTLEKLRDTLLPKLISGELRVRY